MSFPTFAGRKAHGQQRHERRRCECLEVQIWLALRGTRSTAATMALLVLSIRPRAPRFQERGRSLRGLTGEFVCDRRAVDDEAHQRLERRQGIGLEVSDLAITGDAVDRALGPMHPRDDAASSQRSNEDGVAHLEMLCHDVPLSDGGSLQENLPAPLVEWRASALAVVSSSTPRIAQPMPSSVDGRSCAHDDAALGGMHSL